MKTLSGLVSAKVRQFDKNRSTTSPNNEKSNNANGTSSTASSPQGAGSGKKSFFGALGGSVGGGSAASSPTKESPEVSSSSFAVPKKIAIVLPPKRAVIIQPRTREEWFEQMVASEGEYCESLTALRDQYVRPIKDDSKLAKPLYFARQEFQNLVVFLTNVEALLTLNSRFRDELKSRKSSAIAEIFALYAPLFQMYGQYAADYAGAIDTIAAEGDSNEKFAQFLSQKEELTGKSIISMMKQPLDRIKAYEQSCESLLKIIQNSKNPVEGEITALQQALKELQHTAKHVDDQILAAERLERLKQLQKDWTGVNLMAGSVSRSFIMEGDLEKFSRKQQVRYRFLLFSDQLTYGVPIAGGSRVRFKRNLPLASMVVEDNNVSPSANATHLINLTGPRTSVATSRTSISTLEKRESKASIGAISFDGTDLGEDDSVVASPTIGVGANVGLDGDDAFDIDDDDTADNHNNTLTSGALMDDGFSFFILTPTKSFKVAAESAETKAKWMAELRNYIDLVKNPAAGGDGVMTSGNGLLNGNHGSNHSLQFTTSNNNSIESSVPALKPVWVPDDKSKACMKCGVGFTLVRRRHHCRRCGMLVCQMCSRQRMTCKVPAGTKADPNRTREMKMRVCDDCAVKRPSVRYSTEFDRDALKKSLATQPDQQPPLQSPPSYSSDTDDDRQQRRFSSASSTGGMELELVDENLPLHVAPSQTLTCVCIQARTKEELQNGDEIALEVGDVLAIEEIASGWATGTNTMTFEYGFVPANFLHVKDSDVELPEFFDGSTSAATTTTTSAEILSSTAVPATTVQPTLITTKRSFSSDSVPLDTAGSSPASIMLQRRLSSGDATSGSEKEDPSSPMSPFGAQHRRSGSNTTDSERRSSSAGQATSVPPAPTLPFTDKRALIMHEIVLTERSYLSSLNALLTAFVRPLQQDYKSGKPQYGGSVLSVMNEAGDGSAMSVFMSRLEHIVTLNSKLAVDLEARLTQVWANAPPDQGGEASVCTVGDVFLRYAPLFNMYDEYSSSYEFATKTLVDRERSDAKLAKFLEDQTQLNSGILKQQTVLSLLITPIQRVPRYLLLLKEMLKHTKEDHPDRAKIEEAIATISQVARHINEHIRERENMVLLRDIDREFNGTEQLTDNPSRVFLHRGDLIKQSRKKNEWYQFWLFSDLLMYQKKHAKGVYTKPPKRIDIKALMVTDAPRDESSDDRFAFDIVSQSKSFRVFASDTSEKDKWIRTMSEAIETACPGKVSGQKLETTAPVWKQDTSTCEVCEAAFTFLFRRHHCRACGKCVCDKCSKNRMVLKHLDESKEMRVCNPCFEAAQEALPKKPPLTGAAVTASKPGGSISKALATHGWKRSQTERSNIGSSSSTQTMTMPTAPQVQVDPNQISQLSKQFSERRMERQQQVGAASSLGRGDIVLVNSPSPPEIGRRDSVSSPSSTASTARAIPSTSSLSNSSTATTGAKASKLRNEITSEEVDGSKSRADVSREEPKTKKRFEQPTSNIAETQFETQFVPPAERKLEATPSQNFKEVLQQIAREVPLEQPKVQSLVETPKLLPAVKMARPAQLSPAAKAKRKSAEVKAATPSLTGTSSSSADADEVSAKASPPTSSVAASKSPPVIPPKSYNVASAAKPPSPKPQTVKTPGAVTRVPSPKPAEGVNPQTAASTSLKSPTTPPNRPVSGGSSSSPLSSSASKPTPPPLPARRPSSSNLNRSPSAHNMVRTPSSQNVTTAAPPSSAEPPSLSQIDTVSSSALKRFDTATTDGSIDKADLDML